jgi:hypothetical protein
MRRSPPAALALIALVACGRTGPSAPAAGDPGPAPTAPAPVSPPSDPTPPPPAPTPPPADLAAVFPELAGFSRPAAPERYTPANLYDYIDGAAELFLHYGCVELASLEYTRGAGAAAQSITADVYRHDSARDGFGIWSRDHLRAAAVEGVGAAAVHAPGALQFVAGPYYVKLTGYGLGDRDAELLRAAAAALADRLGGATGLPAAVGCFPPDPGGPIEYHASGVLGHGFLRAVFVADYPLADGAGRKLLVVEADDAAGAAATLASYRQLAERKGIAVAADGDTTLLADPYHRELGPLHARLRGRYLLLGFAPDAARAAPLLDPTAACLERLP